MKSLLTPTERRLLDWIEAAEPKALGALKTLVELNTFSENPSNSRRALRVFASLFKSTPFLPTWFHSRKSGFSHLLLSPSSRDRRTLLLGHIDTVYPPSVGFSRFKIVGRRAIGPGVLDMKGGLITIFGAIRALHAIAPEVLTSVHLLVNSDEEIGSPDSHRLIDTIARKFSQALTFEFGRSKDQLIIDRKGLASARVVSRGRAAHAGNGYRKGRSAIRTLADFVLRAEATTDFRRGVTVSVGTIAGGTSRNTISDYAEAELDLRFLSPADGKRQLQILKQLCAKTLVRGTRLKLLDVQTRPPMISTKESRELGERYGSAARACGLRFGFCPRVGGGSDASHVSNVGTPVIDGLGPMGGGAHEPFKEWISIESLTRKTQALALFLLRESQRSL